MITSPTNRRRAARILGTGLMLVLWTTLSISSVSHSIHQWLHHDSNGGVHHCLVTLASKGQLLAGTSTAVFLAPVLAFVPWTDARVEFLPPSRFNLQARGRAPPLVSLYSTW